MMDRYSDKFNEHAETLRERAEQADFDNLQHTIADVETGQQTKHGLKKDEIDPITGKKRNRLQEAVQRTLDWLLANDAAYRAAHTNLLDTVRAAQNDVQTTLEQVMGQLSAATQALDDLLDRAAQLPSGTKVFKDANGRVVDQNGDAIADDLAATIIWRGDEPTYDDYLAHKAHLDDLNKTADDLRGMDTDLGHIRNRATDNKSPLTKDQIDDATDKANAIRDRVKGIQNKLSNAANSDNGRTLDTSNSSPDIEHKTSSSAVPVINLGSN